MLAQLMSPVNPTRSDNRDSCTNSAQIKPFRATLQAQRNPMTKHIHTQEANITKNEGRGWSVETIQRWSDYGTARTYRGQTRLGWAIFDVANWCAHNDTALTSLTINGQPHPRAKAEEAIRKYGIDYAIPKAIAALAIP